MTHRLALILWTVIVVMRMPTIAGANPQIEPLVRATLVADRTAVRPATMFRLALRYEMTAPWHIYWRNAGASGLPTSVHWKLPDGFRAGVLRWPLPERKDIEDVGACLIYSGETMLIADIEVAADVLPGKYSLKARTDWLVCDESCVAGGADVSIDVNVGDVTTPSAEAEAIERFERSVPKPPLVEDGVTMQSTFAGDDTMSRTFRVTLAFSGTIAANEKITAAPLESNAIECSDLRAERTDAHTLTLSGTVRSLKAEPNWNTANLRFVVGVRENRADAAKEMRLVSRRYYFETRANAAESRPSK